MICYLSVHLHGPLQRFTLYGIVKTLKWESKLERKILIIFTNKDLTLLSGKKKSVSILLLRGPCWSFRLHSSHPGWTQTSKRTWIFPHSIKHAKHSIQEMPHRDCQYHAKTKCKVSLYLLVINVSYLSMQVSIEKHQSTRKSQHSTWGYEKRGKMTHSSVTCECWLLCLWAEHI